MGIPKFFRWAGDRYPAILSRPLHEEEPCPFVDNLYLDMNGVIHNCSHGNDNVLYGAADVPLILQKVCDEINHLIVNIVKPQKLVYIAIDGVAPRAKLNQQRARRFKAAKELTRKITEEGGDPSSGGYFDSNCITPGTEFMEQMTKGIEDYIKEAFINNPAWRHLEIVFSGSDVPGEGEHKLIGYIRDQKAEGKMLPNTRHCIYGADADMMMLGIATHEPFVIVLREVVTPPNRSRNVSAKDNHNRHSHGNNEDGNNMLPTTPNVDLLPTPGHANNKPLQYIRVHTLRDYLIHELLEEIQDRDHIELERVLDDFVFLSFFVGNDFLPHLPGISIGDDAFDLIFDAYKKSISTDFGYLLDEQGDLNYDRLESIVALIGAAEAVLYAEQETTRLAKEANKASRHRREGSKSVLIFDNNSSQNPSYASTPLPINNGSEQEGTEYNSHYNNAKLALAEPDLSSAPSPMTISTTESFPPTPATPLLMIDHRRLYYQNKFGFDISCQEGKIALHQVVLEYLKGLIWCLKYYSMGCISWSYYYPYHYGIFLADMRGLRDLAREISFSLDGPLTPFEQLLACLPPASSRLLPACYGPIMTDSESPLQSFYPLDFATDLNGMKMEYEAVVLLPFLDITLLRATERQYCPEELLSDEERRRNTMGQVHLFKMQRDELVEVVSAPVLTPGQRFAPRLIDGTSDSLHGYPLLDDLLTLHRNAFGKTRYSQHELRSAKNQTSSKGSKKNKQDGKFYRMLAQGQKDKAEEAFPMPGTVSLPTLTLDSSLGGNHHVVEEEADRVLGNGEERGVELRLVLDATSDHFLSALAAMVSHQVAAFQTNDEVSDHSCSLRVSLTRLSRHFAHVPLTREEQEDLVEKLAAIFGPVRGAFVPRVVSLGDGRIGVEVEDRSHLDQMDQFILQKVIGSSAFSDHISSVKGGEQTPHIHISAFDHVVVLGTYKGSDLNAFLAWLSSQLEGFADHLPVFHAARLLAVDYSMQDETRQPTIISDKVLVGHP
eukprot:gene5892-6488_t